MPAKREEFEDLKDLAPDTQDDELEESEDEELVEAVDEEAVLPAEEDGGEAASLDELLAQRAAARRGGDDADDDDDIMALASERGELSESGSARVIPIKDQQEFVCNRCRLVKAKSQLADPQRGLCRDCV
jgi:hypothetical protein